MKQGVNVEKAFALHLAKNSKDSRFGIALLEENSKELRLLDRQLQRLEKERTRVVLHSKQVRNMFLHERSSLSEPLLIVERSPSPDVLRRVLVIKQDLDDGVPGYRKPLKTKTRAPSTLTTIDAFAVQNRKKTNVWEDAMKESAEPRFQSAVIPSFPLTHPEMVQLQRGRRVHRPRSFPSKKVRRSQGQGHTSLTPGVPHNLDDMDTARHQVDNSGTFITQLPREGTTIKIGKTVKFAKPENVKVPVRLPLATALVASVDTSQSSKKKKSEELRSSLRKWLKVTENLL